MSQFVSVTMICLPQFLSIIVDRLPQFLSITVDRLPQFLSVFRSFSTVSEHCSGSSATVPKCCCR